MRRVRDDIERDGMTHESIRTQPPEWWDKATVAELCRQALAIYPDCVDALRMLADVEAFWVRDYVTGLRKAIEAGRRELGEEFFREHKGQFWLMMETRPFMRALGALAEVLAGKEMAATCLHMTDAERCPTSSTP